MLQKLKQTGRRLSLAIDNRGDLELGRPLVEVSTDVPEIRRSVREKAEKMERIQLRRNTLIKRSSFNTDNKEEKLQLMGEIVVWFFIVFLITVSFLSDYELKNWEWLNPINLLPSLSSVLKVEINNLPQTIRPDSDHQRRLPAQQVYVSKLLHHIGYFPRSHIHFQVDSALEVLWLPYAPFWRSTLGLVHKSCGKRPGYKRQLKLPDENL